VLVTPSRSVINLCYAWRVTVFVDLPAVRPGRLADAVSADDLTEEVRDFRSHLRDARVVPLPDGVRLVLKLDVRSLALLADLVRTEANERPFWSFRLLADPPDAWLEVRGTGRAGDMARAVFGELGT
jgi:hypothetical protein